MSQHKPPLVDELRELLDLVSEHFQSGNVPCARAKAAMVRAHKALREAGYPVVVERAKRKE